MRPPSDWIDRLPANRCLAEFSLWSADLARLADEVSRISPHADILHIDVADGHFAPGLLFFPDLVAAIRAVTDLPLHVHLMVSDAVLLAQIAQFAEAGADLISFHVENAPLADAAFHLLQQSNVGAGMVLRVETPVRRVEPFIEKLRFLTLLGTAIGVKGQSLDPMATARLGEARHLIAGRSSPERCLLGADGGIRESTVPSLYAAGADTVVMGSLAFAAADLHQRMAWLHQIKRG